MKILIFLVVLLIVSNLIFGDGTLLRILGEYELEGKIAIVILAGLFILSAFLIFLKVVFNHFLSFPDPRSEDDTKEKTIEPEAKTEILDE